jgi:hypothetical protein
VAFLHDRKGNFVLAFQYHHLPMNRLSNGFRLLKVLLKNI